MRAFFLTSVRRWLVMVGFCFTWLIFVSPLPAAELRPFPMPSQPYQYKQSAPVQRVDPQRAEIAAFKRDIARFSCAELKNLRSKIRDQYNRASTYQDKRYFSGFLDALELELKKDNCL